MKNQQIEKLYNEARDLAIAEVVKEARKLMAKHSDLHEFIMAMGIWFFRHKSGMNVDAFDFAYLQPLSDFIDRWDSYMGLTGEGIRFTATGEIVTDW